MPSEEKDFEEAYSRYAKRLKSKMEAQKPSNNEQLRERLKQVDHQAPHRSELFATSDTRLHQLRDEFQIEVQKPQTLQEYIVYFLVQEQIGGKSGIIVSVADLYSEIHAVEEYRKLSSKEFEKTLKRLEKEEKIHLTKIQGTRVLKLNEQFLSEDEATILDIAARKDGNASLEQIMLSTGWTQARVQTALDSLLSKKLVVKKKSYTSGTRYQVSDST